MIYFIIFLVTIIVLFVIDTEEVRTGDRLIVKFYLLLILNEIVITPVYSLHFFDTVSHTFLCIYV